MWGPLRVPQWIVPGGRTLVSQAGAHRVLPLSGGSGGCVHERRYGGSRGGGLRLHTEWFFRMFFKDDRGERNMSLGLHPFFGALFGLPFVGVVRFFLVPYVGAGSASVGCRSYSLSGRGPTGPVALAPGS